MEDKIFFVKDYKMISEDEDLKMRGYTFEPAKNVGSKEEGFYFWVTGDKEIWEKLKVLKSPNVKEITGKEKEKILESFKKLEEDKMSGVGGLF